MGTLRPCVDYQALNAATVKNRYPLPLIKSMIDRLRNAKIFSKVDLRDAYNQVRIREGDEWKTAFRCQYGLFESKVMNFGLTNAPPAFQAFMNDIFRDYLDVFVLVYLDDILIFSNNQADHDKHTCLVLERLRANTLFGKLEKCFFDRTEFEFCGYVIFTEGVHMDPVKIAAVTMWPRPNTVKQVESFLGFANFNRDFIKNYSELATSLHALTHKNQLFVWNDAAEASFTALKQAFASEPVLHHHDSSLPFILECDASDFRYRWDPISSFPWQVAPCCLFFAQVGQGRT